MEWDLVCMLIPGLQERAKWIFSVISDISQSEARSGARDQSEGGTGSEILIRYLVWFPINSHKSHCGPIDKKKVGKWEIIKCQHAPGIKSRVEFKHPDSENIISTFYSPLVFQETAAALTGVTTAHAAHFPSLLTSGDVSPGAQGRRPRPLPAHLASTAPYMGSPYNRRTHKCDYPDCDKVSQTQPWPLLGFKRFNSKSRYGTSRSSSSAHFHSQFGFCPRVPALFECDCWLGRTGLRAAPSSSSSSLSLSRVCPGFSGSLTELKMDLFSQMFGLMTLGWWVDPGIM